MDKVCTKCFQHLPISEFWLSDKARGYHRNSCKKCDKAAIRDRYARSEKFREAAKANSAKWQKVNPKTPEQSRRHSLKHMYALTVEQYDEMLAAQGDKCALCETDNSGRNNPDKKWKAGHWNVDHDHEIGRVRGLVCHKCNVRIGAYEGLMADVGEDKLMRYLHPDRFPSVIQLITNDHGVAVDWVRP